MPKRFGHLEAARTAPTTDNAPIPSGTSLSPLRLTIINDVWKELNNHNNPAFSTSSAQSFVTLLEEERCPDVLNGHKTPKEMEAFAFSYFAPDGKYDQPVAKEDFFAFHEEILSAFPDQTEKEVKLLLHWIWKLNQPDPKFRSLRKDELAKLNKELFQSSAYRGQDFRNDAKPDDAVDMYKGNEPMSKLVPFPMPKQGHLPPELQGRYYSGAPIGHHRTHMHRHGDETLKNRPAFEGEPSSVGRVAGNPRSLGFLDHETSNQGYGAGALHDPVIDAHTRGKESEQEAARRRLAVLNAPFATAEPPHFKSTTHMEHLDFNPVMDRTSDKPIRATDKEWSKAADDVRGNRGLRRAGDGKTGPDALPAELVEMEKELQARNRRNARGPPAFDWLTTQREHYAGIDQVSSNESNDRWATKPTLHAAHYALQATAEREPRLQRELGSLNTEYTDNMIKKVNEHYDTKFHHPGVLDLKNGTHQMKTAWHKPRQDTIGEKEPGLNASSVVPRQFATTTSHFSEIGYKTNKSTVKK